MGTTRHLTEFFCNLLTQIWCCLKTLMSRYFVPLNLVPGHINFLNSPLCCTTVQSILNDTLYLRYENCYKPNGWGTYRKPGYTKMKEPPLLLFGFFVDTTGTLSTSTAWHLGEKKKKISFVNYKNNKLTGPILLNAGQESNLILAKVCGKKHLILNAGKKWMILEEKKGFSHLLGQEKKIPKPVFFSGGKNDPKTLKFLKNQTFFWREILGKCSDLFSKKISGKVLRFWSKNCWFNKILAKF